MLEPAVAKTGHATPRACPLCGSRSNTLLLEREGWPVVRCACAMVYLARELSYQQQAAEHEFAETYVAEHARRRRAHPLLQAISSVTRKLKPPMPVRLLRQTLRWWPAGRGGPLLDIGCGDGAFLEAAAQHFTVTGVEISAAQAKRARQRLPGATIFTGPSTEIALPEDTFDVVTQFSVLEHEWHPLPALRRVARTLRPGGITILKVPNFASWNRVLRGAEWCGIRLPDHCNYFTPQTLAAALAAAGLAPLPGSFADRMPTSDSLWMAAQKP